jgi:hypothetical protein
MSTLFAFLHRVAAFTLVSALAVEFILIERRIIDRGARPAILSLLRRAAGACA